MIFIGFDPGKKGAMAALENGQVVHCEPYPFIGDELDIQELAKTILQLRAGKVVMAVLEKVHAMPKQGVTSMFSFGKTYGEIRGMLKALSIAIIEPPPGSWKKVVLSGIDWKGRKAASWEHVMRKYPDVNLKPGKKRTPHDGIADSICLAEFGQWYSR